MEALVTKRWSRWASRRRGLRCPRALALALLMGAGAGCEVPGSQGDGAQTTRAEIAASSIFSPGGQQSDTVQRQGLQRQVDDTRRTAIVQAAERVSQSVVSVNVIRRQSVQPRSLWESLMLPRQRRAAGIGSGFIVHEDGLVLTNEHVVRDAEVVVVTLTDGRDFQAEIVGTDEVTDLAILRIPAQEGRPLPVAPPGRSDDLMIGEWVVALGNPLGYLLSNTEPSVTLGVVSGVGRHIIPSDGEERGYYLDMIQTDASINPGNSGGPLVNLAGEVIGVSSSIFSRSGGSEGLGFAIPIDRARRVLMDLVNEGRVRRAWTGIEVEPAMTNQFGRSQRVRVADVVEGSPAHEAGLRAPMILLRVGGRPIRTQWDWEAAILDSRVGEPLEVVAGEDGARTFTLIPSGLPSLTAARIRALEDFELVTLTPAIQAERGLGNDRGALIVDLSETARNLGLREGDLILQINRTRITTAPEVAQLLSGLAGQGVPIRMFVERDGRVVSSSFYIR